MFRPWKLVIHRNHTFTFIWMGNGICDGFWQALEHIIINIKKLKDIVFTYLSNLKIILFIFNIQFNKETTPKRLGNWQVPRWAPTRARPVEMRPNPKPICDINGRFLPGAPRGSSKCFGHFTGTWELPRKITRKVGK